MDAAPARCLVARASRRYHSLSVTSGKRLRTSPGTLVAPFPQEPGEGLGAGGGHGDHLGNAPRGGFAMTEETQRALHLAAHTLFQSRVEMLHLSGGIEIAAKLHGVWH